MTKSRTGTKLGQSISMARITVHELLELCSGNRVVSGKPSPHSSILTLFHDVGDRSLRGITDGNCIFTASMSGHAANVPQEQSCYNACKAGVIHLAKSLAVEWAKWGGRVNCVSPGYIDTAISGDCPFEMKEEWFSLTPMKRDADPRELKGAYLFLASDASSYCTGTDIVVDGGYVCR